MIEDANIVVSSSAFGRFPISMHKTDRKNYYVERSAESRRTIWRVIGHVPLPEKNSTR